MFARSTQRTLQVLLCASASCLALSAAAAQTAPAAATATPDAPAGAEEVVVTASPIRESFRAGLAVKRRAPNVVDVIAADTIGRFPDQTAAAALARLPAIGVQRDQGQERYIQVRGAPARWTTVAFDGVNVLGAEDRVFRFDSVPAAIIQQVQLNKTLTPDMPAEALAGRVNILTFSPMSREGFRAQGDFGLGFVDLGDGENESASLRLSWSNDWIGVSLAASRINFEQQTDNMEPRYDAIGLVSNRHTKYVIDRATSSLNAKVEIKLNENHKITLSSLYSEFVDDELRTQITFAMTGGIGTRGIETGSLLSVQATGLYEEGRYETNTNFNLIQGDHAFGKLDVSWDLSYTRSESITFLPLIASTQSNRLLRPSLTYVRGNQAGVPVITLFDTIAGPTPGTFAFGAPRQAINQLAYDTEAFVIFGLYNETKEWSGKVDFTYAWESFGAEATLAFGLKYDDRTFTDPGNQAFLRPNGTVGTVLARPTAAALNVPWTPLQHISTQPIEEAIRKGWTWNWANNELMRAQFDAIMAASVAANAQGGSFPVNRPNPLLANGIDERLLSAYIQNTWRWEKITLLAGVRLENAKVASSGLATIGAVTRPIALESDDTLVFPSLHLTYDWSEDIKLRAAFISGAARPSFVDQRATVTINDAQQTVAGGNPFLVPEKAYGFDASAEWYFDEASILAANFFYRDVSDVLFDATGIVGDARFNSDNINRAAYTYTTTLNGGDGYLMGFEVSYIDQFEFLPGALDGLGVSLSAAFLDGEFETPSGRKAAFPGTSDAIYTASLTYEKYGISARLSWQYRTDWLDEISPGTSADSDLYWDAAQRLDLSVRYALNENLTLYFDGVNLTDEFGLRYQGNESRPYELESFGRRFLWGIRANF